MTRSVFGSLVALAFLSVIALPDLGQAQTLPPSLDSTARIAAPASSSTQALPDETTALLSKDPPPLSAPQDHHSADGQKKVGAPDIQFGFTPKTSAAPASGKMTVQTARSKKSTAKKAHKSKRGKVTRARKSAQKGFTPYRNHKGEAKQIPYKTPLPDPLMPGVPVEVTVRTVLQQWGKTYDEKAVSTQTYHLPVEDVIVFSMATNDPACPLEYFIMSSINGQAYTPARRIGNCAGSYGFDIRNGVLYLIFPQADRRVEFADQWRYTHGVPQKIQPCLDPPTSVQPPEHPRCRG
ncbi:MAG: hypothetical protein IPI58_09170 [Alphaproteobacteria bacterium]|nr:MAG: hypothetical protein IPI58_09170 [Alphaproteobacteria bacterium]